MKRTPPWVFVAAAMVQLAGLGLCVWAMERWVRDAEEEQGRAALAPAPPAPAAGLLFPPSAAPQAVQASSTRSAPSPAAANGSRVPAFIAEDADGRTQLLRGEIAGRSLIFAFYANGKIKVVDVDGSCYHGTTESARARMREVGGTRAFTVRLDDAGEGRLRASFTGGAHDNATIGLDEYVGRNIV
jgi:hypothetical protein